MIGSPFPPRACPPGQARRRPAKHTRCPPGRQTTPMGTAQQDQGDDGAEGGVDGGTDGGGEDGGAEGGSGVGGGTVTVRLVDSAISVYVFWSCGMSALIATMVSV